MTTKLLYLGPVYDYGDHRRGYSFEYRNFQLPLKRYCLQRGWEFLHYDFHQRSIEIGQPLMTEELYELVKNERPQCLFSVLYDFHVDPYYEVFSQVSDEFGTTTINWFCDDHWRYDAYTARVAPKFDLCCTTSSLAVKKYQDHGLGHKVVKSQWACDEQVYRPLPAVQDVEMSFIGQPHGDRREVIDTLNASGLDVRVFGYGWKNASRLPFHQMLRMFSRSKINLNLGNSSITNTQQLKGRNFEVPAVRGFLLTSALPELGEYFDIDQEVVTYNTPEELVDKAKYYLAHSEQRLRIAERGYHRVLAEHTWQHRFADIFRAVGLLPRHKTITVPLGASRFFSNAEPVPADPQGNASAKNNHSLVSVVIPCYEQAGYLADAVASIVWQTYSHWEVIIVNDGSPDRTTHVARDLIARFPGRSITLIEQENRGIAAARNTGMAAATGGYLIPLDADDMLRHDALERLVAVLDGDPEVDIVYPSAMKFGKEYGCLTTQAYDFRRLCVQNLLVYSSMFRLAVWEKTGGYNESMHIGYEDWEFWINCGKHGLRFYQHPGRFLLYRIKECSMITAAKEQDALLKARIVSLHPDLYSDRTRAWSVDVLRGDDVPATAFVGQDNPMPLVADLSKYRRNGTTFCIITNGNRPAILTEQVASIHRLGLKNYEIIVCGNPHTTLDGVETIQAQSTAREGRLGDLRNQATAAAKFKTLVVSDDDIVFRPDFGRALMAERQHSGLFSARIVNLDGTRYWDWARTSSEYGQELVDYGEVYPDNYVTGGLVILPASVCDEIQWHEKLGFRQSEDVDFTNRVKARGYTIRFASSCVAYHCTAWYTQVDRRVLTRSEEGVRRWLGGEFGLLNCRQLIEGASACLDQGEFGDAADYLRACLHREPENYDAQRLWVRLGTSEQADTSIVDWNPGGHDIRLPGVEIGDDLRAEFAIMSSVAEEKYSAEGINADLKLPAMCSVTEEKYSAEGINADLRLPAWYAFQNSALRYRTGVLRDGRVYCSAAQHEPGHCIYGPYLYSSCRRDLAVVFWVKRVGKLSRNGPALSLDVYDASANRILVHRSVGGNALKTDEMAPIFVSFRSEIGQSLEFRLYWHGTADIVVYGVKLYAGRGGTQKNGAPHRPVTNSEGATTRVAGMKFR